MSLHSKSAYSDDSQPVNPKEISFLIAGLTLCYLCFASIYSTSNWLVRLLTIFFGVKFDCYFLGFFVIAYPLTKCSFYVLFVARLHLTFHGSSLAVKPKYLITLCIISVFALFGATAFFFLTWKSDLDKHGGDCSQRTDFKLPLQWVMPAVLVDTITCIILLCLFLHKLSELVRAQTSRMTSFHSLVSADEMAAQRIKNLILVMTKLTVLVCVYIIGYWLLLVIFYPILPGSSSMIDVVIGGCCVIFCYEVSTRCT